MKIVPSREVAVHRSTLVTAVFAALPAALLVLAVSGAPAVAVTAKDKMATCKFGADDQKLKGPARTKFMNKCMSAKNDPRGMATPPPPPATTPPKN
jgi:psiF repeat